MDEDIILPDDFAETPSSEQTEEVTGTEISANPTEQVTKPSERSTETNEPAGQSPQTLKIKYNHEERDIPIEEAIALTQKGLNYDKAVERARQEAAQQAKDEFIANLGYEWNGKPIRSEAEYKQALQEKELLDRYQDRDIPPEIIQELMEGRKDREERKAERAILEAQKQREAQIAEFAEAFPSVDTASIKQETWDRVEKGIPLKYAYMEQERAELTTRLKVLEQNQKNQTRAPVQGVSLHGTGDNTDPFLEGFDSI